MRLENKKLQQRAGVESMTGNITRETLYAESIFLSRKKGGCFRGDKAQPGVAVLLRKERG
jgi:hypothetical protein